MLSNLKKTKIQEIITVFVLYIIFLLIGSAVFKDYGISVDEWELRLHGFSNLIYVCNIFFKETALHLTSTIVAPILSDYYGTHGPIFNFSTAFIEFLFQIEDSKNYYLMRHYLNNLIFVIGNFYFYLLVRQRFNNWLYALIGAIFLFCSPRIFAESFYNHKDVVFLSLFIISLYYGILFYKKPNFKHLFIFSFTTALSIDMRIMGVIIVPLIMFFTYIKHFKYNKKILFYILTFSILLFLFIILFWPYLWGNPLTNFYKAFATLNNYPYEGYNFYLGSYHLASDPPWHYSLTWIFITTPFLYLALFLFGFISYTSKFFKNIKKFIKNEDLNQILKDESNGEDLIYYLLFILPLFLVIIFNSTLYTGWRHLYFVYPSLLIFSVSGYSIIKSKLLNNNSLLINLIIFILLAQITFTMYKFHPHQNVYFNLLAGKKPQNNFEVDYWGLSNKQAFEFILENNNKRIINIGSGGPTSLTNSLKILNINERKRIAITENINADFIIDNHINWHGKYKKKRHKVPKKFKIYKEIFIDEIKIVSIYKKL